MLMKLQGETELERLLLGVLRAAQGYDVAECRAMISSGLTTVDTLQLRAVLGILSEAPLDYDLETKLLPWKITGVITDFVAGIPVRHTEPDSVPLIEYTTPDVWWGATEFVFTDEPDTPLQRAARDLLDILLFRKYIPAVPDGSFHLVYHDPAISNLAIGGVFTPGASHRDWKFHVLATGPSCQEVIHRLCDLDLRFLGDNGLKLGRFFKIRHHFPSTDEVEDDPATEPFDFGMVL